MKNWVFPFLFAAFCYAAAAPAHDEDSLEVILQEALDDREDQYHRRVQDSAPPDDPPLPGVLPSTTLRFVSSRRIHRGGETQKPHTQRFLPKEVQERYRSDTNQDPEEEESVEEPENEDAEIQKLKIFKSLLGKALKVLQHKLGRRSRTDEEDREASRNPTNWKDLTRNFLRTLGDQEELEENAEEQVTKEAEIELFRTFLSKAQDKLDNDRSEPQKEVGIEALLPDPTADRTQEDQIAKEQFIHKLARKFVRWLRRIRRRG